MPEGFFAEGWPKPPLTDARSGLRPIPREMLADATSYAKSPVLYPNGPASSVAMRRFGSGPPLVLLHGFPLHGGTYRHLLPQLSERRTCYVFDLLGAGESRWQPRDDFSFASQARRVSQALEAWDVGPYEVVAQDSGGVVARLLALLDGERVRRLALINTEVPGHRPPWIPLYGKLLSLPGSSACFQWLLRSNAFLRSSAGFGGSFVDTQLIDGEFHALFIEPLTRSRRRVLGYGRFLSGLDWGEVDALAAQHAAIRARVLLLWGEADPTFPVSEGQRLAAQLPTCVDLLTIAGAKLFPQEEQPHEVLRYLEGFLG